MINLGFNMSGTEEVFEQMLRKAFPNMRDERPFVYYEIGIAEGTTLAAVADLLVDEKLFPFNCLGADLVYCPFLDVKKFLSEHRQHDIQISFDGVNTHADQRYRPITNGISIFLFRDANRVRLAMNSTKDTLNFVMIDGCHGAACVTKDFLSIEDAVRHGGIVAFHDARPDDQGKSYQPHCKEDINVRKALIDLGLIADDSREGWRHIGSVDGDKSREGNGFEFFQKI
jgi:hypothetical protein